MSWIDLFALAAVKALEQLADDRLLLLGPTKLGAKNWMFVGGKDTGGLGLYPGAG
jgi:hypothetical protein